MSWLLLLIVLAALTVLGTYFFGTVLGRGEELLDEPYDLNSANLRALNDGGEVRFEHCLRGYKPEQVDAVIDHLLQRQKRSTMEDIPVKGIRHGSNEAAHRKRSDGGR